MPFWLTKPRASPAANPEEMATVAEKRLTSSASLTVSAESIATGDDNSVYAVGPPLVVRIGESSTAVTVTFLVALALESVPSLTANAIVRVDVLGVSEVSIYVIDRSALCHC